MLDIRSKRACHGVGAMVAALLLPAAVMAAPAVSTTFSAVNQVTRSARVQVTLSNPDSEVSQLTAALSDALPAGLRVMDPPRAASTCFGGGLQIQPTAVTLASGATVPAAGSCTFAFDVVADAPGDYENRIAAGALQTSTGANAQAATATLNLTALASAIGLSKRFLPSTIVPGGSSRLTITLSNSTDSQVSTFTAADLVDNLPAGVVVAAQPNASTTCRGGSVSTTSTSLTLASGAELEPFLGGPCSFGADVTAASAGNYVNVIPAGALQTPIGNSATAAMATLNVVQPGPGNGGFTQGPFYSEFTNLGATALNFVAGQTGTISTTLDGDFDIGFTIRSDGYNAVLMPQHGGSVAVDASGKALVLRIGDTVGPERVFAEPNQADRMVVLGEEFQRGTNAFVGVRFLCDGRLQYPVRDRYCYGYVHLITGGGNRPKGLVESAFNGDGAPIVIARGVGLDSPKLSMTPNKLDLLAPADGVASARLRLGNGNGSDPLVYAAGSRQTRQEGGVLRPSGQAATPGPAPANAALASSPWVLPGGTIDFILDDGMLDGVAGAGEFIPGFWSRSFGAVYLNQFSATESLTIDSISVYWPAAAVNGEPTGMATGLPVKLAVFYDPASTGNPANAVRVTADEIVTIDTLDAFQTYPLRARIPAAGDVYVGFVSHWANVAAGTEPFVTVAALDTTAPLSGRSWVSYVQARLWGQVADDRRLSNNSRTVAVEDDGRSGNFLIRATAAPGGVGGLCSGAPVGWVSATPAAGSIDGGGSVDIDVRADPANLAAGVHNAELCLTTNDPDDPVFWVPITFTVLAAGSPACATPDTIFCAGHERRLAPTVSAGIIDQVADGAGHGFDFSKGQFTVDTGDRAGKDIFLYMGFGIPSLQVDWATETLPADIAAQVGGVVDTGGTDYAALQPGATIGPASTFSNNFDSTMAAFAQGGRFYLGVRFYNETRRTLNYGYLQLETSPEGFPVRLIDYAYDWDGRAIVIPEP